MNNALELQLTAFAKKYKFSGKGALCVALVITNKAKGGLPLDAGKLMTLAKGQVEGLGKAAVQTILARHGISRVLAEEGGRTSRGSVGNMISYVEFLNSLPKKTDLDLVENYWVGRVREFFAGKPFKFRLDLSLSIRAAVRHLLAQARERQQSLVGSRYEGPMLQHLVGAKLDLVLGTGKVMHHSASEADQADRRAGDFVVGDVAIHVTTNPGEALMRKCAGNLDAGLHPLIVTLPAKTAVADSLAEDASISARIDVLDIEQFLAANLHERALFQSKNRGPKTEELISRYNSIIDAHETDPSLKISPVYQ